MNSSSLMLNESDLFELPRVKDSLSTLIISSVATTTSFIITIVDSFAIIVLFQCKLMPVCAQMMSINFILCDALGSLTFAICQSYVFATGYVGIIVGNVRSLGTGFMLLIASISVSMLTMDRALALKISLRYADIVTKQRVIYVIAWIWILITIIVPVLVYIGYSQYCLAEQCNLWAATMHARRFVTGTMVACQVAVVLCYMYVFKVARAHQRAVGATTTADRSNRGGFVSQAQLNTTTAMMQLILAFIICYTPIVIHLIIFETYPTLRDSVLARFLHGVAYLALQMNSFISLGIYVGRFKECKLRILKMRATFCSTYSEEVESLRREVYNIVSSREDNEPSTSRTGQGSILH